MLEETVEPYLLQCGLIIRTPRGRMACARAYAHLGLKEPPQIVQKPVQTGLFGDEGD